MFVFVLTYLKQDLLSDSTHHYTVHLALAISDISVFLPYSYSYTTVIEVDRTALNVYAPSPLCVHLFPPGRASRPAGQDQTSQAEKRSAGSLVESGSSRGWNHR